MLNMDRILPSVVDFGMLFGTKLTKKILNDDHINMMIP